MVLFPWKLLGCFPQIKMTQTGLSHKAGRLSRVGQEAPVRAKYYGCGENNMQTLARKHTCMHTFLGHLYIHVPTRTHTHMYTLSPAL